MIFLRACFAAIRLSLASLAQRLWPALIVVAGIACVVGVLLSMLSMTVGLRHAWQRAGSPDRAIILPVGAQDEGDGNISRDEAEIIHDAPGIARDAKGRALADSEMLIGMDARRRATGGTASSSCAALGPWGWQFGLSFASSPAACFGPASAK